MKLFIQQAKRSSLKLQNLETLSSMSQDEMMDWSGGYGKSTCCDHSGSRGHHQHTKTYEHMGPYGMVTSTVTECCIVNWHINPPIFVDPAPNPPHWIRPIEDGKEKNYHICRGNHDHH